MLSKCRFDDAEGSVDASVRDEESQKSLPWRKDMTSNTYSTSDVINIVEVPQTPYIDRIRDLFFVHEKWLFQFSREACVFLKLVTSELG